MTPVERLRFWADVMWRWVRPNLRTFRETRTPKLWLLSLIIGAAVAVAAVMFREAIGLVQYWWLRNTTEQTLTAAQNVGWYWVLAAPIVGGLVVGRLLERVSARRAGNVADVIEARALTGRPLGLRDGLWSAAISAISLGSGASAGREGPVIHLGATLASVIASRRKLPEWCARTLLASGVAAAISASFNAPIAGVLFAHEVILQHYSMRSFVPIVIASAVGSVISRIWFGEASAFIIPDYQITSYWEFPAFALLGVVAALVAIAFQFALFSADYVARSVTIPLRYKPVVGGAIIGVMGIFFPHILGVGYEVTDKVLWNQLPLSLLIMLIVMKTAATAITLAARFGGGIFSPAIYLGALTGGAFGLIAGSAFPDMASSEGLYAILGMGAVAGAVLGPLAAADMLLPPIITDRLLNYAIAATGVTVALSCWIAVRRGSRVVCASCSSGKCP